MAATAITLVALICSAMALVNYFMHDVYEEEEFLELVDVPVEVLERFDELYPDAANVMWEFEEGTFEAEFIGDDGMEKEVLFQPDGTLEREVFEAKLAEFPARAQLYLQRQSGYQIIEPEKLVLDGAVRFEAKLANSLMEWSCVFDEQGNLVSKTRDGPVLE